MGYRASYDCFKVYECVYAYFSGKKIHGFYYFLKINAYWDSPQYCFKYFTYIYDT